MSKNLKFAFEIAGKISSSFSSSFKSANDIMEKTKSELKGLNDLQKNLNDNFNKGVISQQAYNNAMAQTSKQAKELHDKQKGLSALQSAKGQITNGGLFKKAAVVGGVLFAPAIKSAMDFESSMADVRKVVDELKDPAQFKAMSSEILNLSKRIPMAAEDIAKIVAFGGQSGIAKDELMEFAEGASKMGIAFDISAEQAGETMAKWRAAFGMNQKEVVELADAVNHLSDNNNARAASIAEVLNKIGSLGDIAGVGSRELAALGTVMMETGTESDVAGTGIKNFLLTMSKGNSATKRQAEAFSRLGFDAQELAKRMQVDAKGAMLDLLKAMQKVDAAEQTSVLTDLFGKESIAAIAPLVTNLDKLEGLFVELGDSVNFAGSMEREFASRSATTANAFQLTKNSISAIAIELGSVLLPTVAGTFKSISEVASAVGEWSQKNPKLSSTIVKVAAGVTLFATGVGGLGWAISSIAGPLGKIISIIRIITGVMMANPILLAITALIVAGYLLYENWELVKSKALEIWNEIVNTAEWAIKKYINFWVTLPEKAAYFLGLVVGFLWALPEKIYSIVSKIPVIIYEIVSQIPKIISSNAPVLLNAAGTWIDGAIDYISSRIAELPNILMNALGNIGNGLASWWNGVDLTGNFKAGMSVAQNAQGGIYNRGAFLTTFAEDGPEAAIPLDGSSRAVSLWQRAGEMLGVGDGNANAGGIAISAPINITITGNADSNTVNQIQQAVNDALADLERKIAALQNQKARVSYV